MDFLLALIELFSLGVTASDYWLKIGDFAQMGVG